MFTFHVCFKILTAEPVLTVAKTGRISYDVTHRKAVVQPGCKNCVMKSCLYILPRFKIKEKIK